MQRGSIAKVNPSDMARTPSDSNTSKRTKRSQRSHAISNLSCSVIVKDKEYSLLYSPESDTAWLVNAAIKKYIAEHSVDDPQMTILFHRRLERELDLKISIEENGIVDGDVLELRAKPVADAYEIRQGKTIKQHAKTGYFIVSAIRGKNLREVQILGDLAPIVTFFLRPYRTVTAMTLPSTGSSPTWEKSSYLKLKHSSNSKTPKLKIEVRHDRSFGANPLIGFAEVDLDLYLQKPNTTKEKWVELRKEEDDSTCGKILITIAFHPQQFKLSNLGGIMKKATEHSSNVFQKMGRKQSIRNEELDPNTTSKPPDCIIGKLFFELRGIHICSSQCSKVDGHADIKKLEFKPSIQISFADYFNNLRDLPSDPHLQFSHEWNVTSVHSTLHLEVFKKYTVGGSSTNVISQLLESKGDAMEHLCELKLSLFEIQERQFEKWTRLKEEKNLVPGNRNTLPNFLWLPLRHNEEEIGLVHVRFAYKEDLSMILSPIPSCDVNYVDPDEMKFQGAIIKRHFQRLDLIIANIKMTQKVVSAIMEWRSYPLTLLVWGAYTSICLYFPASYWPFLPLFGIVSGLTVKFVERISGKYARDWITYDPDDFYGGIFRPMGFLKIAPIKASNLRPLTETKGITTDPFVRIFYEPNFKNQPAHPIGQTSTVHSSVSPHWGGAPKNKRVGKMAKAVQSGWLKDTIHHLTKFDQDIVLNDVVEEWQCKNGDVMDAFKYPILQPVHKVVDESEESLTPWEKAPGFIRIDVLDESAFTSSTELLGQARIPLRRLVTNEATGGSQEELHLTIPLCYPSYCPKTVKENEQSHTNGQGELGTINLRVQLTLREKSASISAQEKIFQESVYNMTEMEHEKDLSFLQMYHKAKDVATNIQKTIGIVCDSIERLKNLFNWTDLRKTGVVYVLLSVGCIATYNIPIRYLAVLYGCKKFSKKFHKMKDRDVTRFINLISSLPTDVDLKKIFYWRNVQYLEQKNYIEVQAKLQAVWAGNIWKRGDGPFGGWQLRYAIARGGKLEWWQNIKDAKSGIPSRYQLTLSNKWEHISEGEKKDLVKDTYPICIYDVSRRGRKESELGRRRLIATTSEEDHTMLTAYINRCPALSY